MKRWTTLHLIFRLHGGPHERLQRATISPPGLSLATPDVMYLCGGKMQEYHWKRWGVSGVNTD